MTDTVTAAPMSEQDRLFCDYPAKYFNFSYTEAHSIPRAELEAMQLRCLQGRFAELRDNIPMLKKLADRQGVDSINELNDVVPLLFEHTMYKSYPPQLLEQYRFKDINRWLNKLTTHDLKDLDVSGCESLDEYLEYMLQHSPLAVGTSSGTTGTMSFMPHGKDEMDRHADTMKMTYLQNYGDDAVENVDNDLHIIHPYFRRHGSGRTYELDAMIKILLNGDESRFHAAYPGGMSLDVLYLSARMKAAQQKGELDKLVIQPALLKRKEEFEQIDKDMPKQLEAFIDEMVEKLAGKRIFLVGTWSLLHAIAERGLSRGLEKVFAPNSIVIQGGGNKGMTPPDNWQEDVARFIGLPRLKGLYAYTEALGRHVTCEHGNYHIAPWIIPFVLDPETSKPLPRTGIQTGRMASFDLLANTHWGGAITGDEVTINFDQPSPSGMTTPFVQGEISRFSEKQGGSDKISCAATPGAHKEAMDFLTNIKE